MNNSSIPDIQNLSDNRNVMINKVGIRGIRRPVTILTRDGNLQHSNACFDMSVSLPAHARGTHMSRFIEILENSAPVFSYTSFEATLRTMTQRLDASAGDIQMVFPYFIHKTAPVSGVKSYMDYQVSFKGVLTEQSYTFTLKVVVPVTSLCPCSKEIAENGAHNQRSLISISADIHQLVWAEELIDMAEQQASCELYSLLKRPDEKYVTEKAYQTPKFVEDIVRDIALTLEQDARIHAYTVESENFESIHNHSAYAMVTREK